MKSSSVSSVPHASSLSRAALGTLSVLAVCFAATPAHAQFSGAYDPANWTFTNTNADGSVNTTTAPAAIRVDGGANGSGAPGSTTYSILANAAGTVSFNWNYSTGGFYAFSDPFDFLVFDSGVKHRERFLHDAGSSWGCADVSHQHHKQFSRQRQCHDLQLFGSRYAALH
jgi:hypothetical protein